MLPFLPMLAPVWRFLWSDKRNLIIGVLSTAVVLLLLTNLQTCRRTTFDCNTCTETVKVVYDTIWPKDTAVKLVYLGKPAPVKHWPGKVPAKPITKRDTVILQGGTMVITKCEPQDCNCNTLCDDLRAYKLDTTYSDIHLKVFDTVQGELVGRSVWLANLKPQIQTTITKVVKEKPRCYLGAGFTIPGNKGDLHRWGIGPGALLTIPKVGGISYYYDAKNNAHSGSVFVLLKFKR